MFVHTPGLTQAEMASAIIQNPLVVSSQATIGEAIAHISALRASRSGSEGNPLERLHREERATCLLVVENHQLVGIFTERDAVRLNTQSPSSATRPISDVMTASVTRLRESAFTDLLSVIQLFQEHCTHHLPIVDDQNRPVGLITLATAFQALNPLGLYHLVGGMERKITLLESTVEALVINPDAAAMLQPTVLDSSEATRWQFALEGTGDGVWDWNVQTNQVLFSPHWKTMLGYADNDIGDMLDEWSQRIHPEDTERCYADLNRYFRGETPIYQNEHRVRCKDGSYKWILDRGKVVKYSPTGQPLRMIGTHSDISDRKQTELALAESERRLSTLIGNLPGYVYRVEVNPDYTPIFISSGVTAITGYAVEEYLVERSISCGQEMHPQDADAIWEIVQQALSQHQPYECEYRLFTKTGEEKWVWERGQGIYSAQGEPLYLEGFVTDITARKTAEQALRQATQERERAEDALRQVTAGTATTIGGDFFPALVSHIAEALDVRYVSVSQATPHGFKILAFFADGVLAPPDVLPYCSVPCCVQALEIGECCHPDSIQSLYPNNLLFSNLQVESYLGIGLRNAAGEPSGNLCILDDRPLPNPEWAKTLLRIFAARAGAELERHQTALALEQLTAELEQRVQERTTQLWEREAQLEDLFDNANDLIQSVWLVDGRFEYVNRAWREILGYSEADLEHLTIFDVLHPAYHGHCQGLIAQMQEGAICTLDRMELTFLTKDRREILLEGSLNCRLEGDRPVSTRAIFRDITERKAAEQRLQEREARYRAVMDHASDAIILANRQGHLVEVNRKAEELLGYSRDALMEMNVSQIHPSEVLDAVAQHFGGILEKNHGPSFETLVQRKDGSCIPVDITGSRLELNGEPIGQGIFRDIRDRKHTELVIRQQAERETLLRETTQRIRQSLDLQTIFDTACQEVRQVFHADRVGIFKFYPKSGHNVGEFVAESVIDGYPSVVAIRIHDHCFGEKYAPLYIQGRYSAVEDIYRLEACHTHILAQFKVRANLIMPLMYGDDLWGLLCIHQCHSPRSWEPTEIDLAQQLANQLAIAIQQAILYEQVQVELMVRQRAEAKIAQQLHQQKILGNIVQHIRESLDLDAILATVTQQVKDVLQGDRVLVIRLSPDNRGHIVEEAVASEFPTLKDRQWPDETWSQETLDHYHQGKPRIFLEALDDTWKDCLVAYSIAGQVQSKMVAPILQDMCKGETSKDGGPFRQTSQLWGILVVHACQEKRIWRETEAQLLQQIANQLAIAIQQASLFQQVQQELTERQQTQLLLTERNQQLAISNEELARATRLKDEFLANMSHELRTPLNAVLGMTEGLLEEVFGPLSDQQVKALNTVDHSATHLLSLINDILDVAKIESGQIDLDYASVSPVPLCSSSLAFIKQQALKKRIHLETMLASNLPSVLVDERRIRQVLINLLSNAVKFTPEGGKVTLAMAPHLEAEPSNPRHYLRIAVTDTGIGIAPENISKLFQPFVQIDSALNRQFNGTGLGLALVKQIVELHGGRVGLTSELGVGSCFTIDLPYNPDDSASSRVATSADSQPVDGGLPFPHTDASVPHLILLAEDNEANVSTVMSYLGARGYRILLAKNGREAIALAQAEHPALILMDIQMPGMDGLEVMQHLRRDPTLANVPIIALTALAMTGDRDRCLAAGANEYLAKPVRLKQLATMIRKLLPEV